MFISAVTLNEVLFFIVKILIFCIFLHENLLWHSLAVPRRGVSNDYPQNMFCIEIRKNIFQIPPLIWSYNCRHKNCPVKAHLSNTSDMDNVMIMRDNCSLQKLYVVGAHKNRLA